GAAQQAREATTVPSAGLDREPNVLPPPAPTPTTAKPAPPTTTDEGPAVVLKGDGIGAFIFGADPDQVIAGLTLRWGPPDGDTGWVPAGTTTYGACPGNVVRAVNWRGFAVLFSDGATPPGQARVRPLFTWAYQVDDPAPPSPDHPGHPPPLPAATRLPPGATVAPLPPALPGSGPAGGGAEAARAARGRGRAAGGDRPAARPARDRRDDREGDPGGAGRGDAVVPPAPRGGGPEERRGRRPARALRGSG